MGIEHCSASAEQRVRIVEAQFKEQIEQQKAVAEEAQRRFQEQYWCLGREISGAKAENNNTKEQNPKIVGLVNELKGAVTERDNVILKMNQDMLRLKEKVNVVQAEANKWKEAFYAACSAGVVTLC